MDEAPSELVDGQVYHQGSEASPGRRTRRQHAAARRNDARADGTLVRVPQRGVAATGERPPVRC